MTILESLNFNINTGLLTTSLLGLFIIYNFKKWYNMRKHFEKCNLKGPKPSPIIGNFFSIIQRGMPYNDKYLIDTYGKTLGYFEFASPVILTTDPKLLKLILIKDFNNFSNRNAIEAIQFDPLDRMLSFLKDDEWKNTRSILSAVFSSGKLKSMSKLMIECSYRLNDHLVKLEEKDEYFDARKLFGYLSLDMMCSCCFGFSVDSINDPNNEILKHVRNLSIDSLTKDPRLILLILFPKFTNFLRERKLFNYFCPKESTDYLKSLSAEIINRRKNKLEKRDDFIQIMVEHEEQIKNEDNLKQKTEQTWDSKTSVLKKTLSTEEIFSQAIMFLFAGYETSSIALNLISYNLATHPECQDLLCQEVDKILEKYGEISYDSVQEMNYMNMVIDETLRMYPPALRFDRVAKEDYEYEDIKIKKGQIISVPIWALHHDEEVYPDPDKFIPERFNDENKKSRDSSAYLPFGSGPRSCIGMRFAFLEIKFTLAAILSKFKFVKCDKTPEKIQIDSSGISRPIVPNILKLHNRF
nr:cytochrome p450 CYP3044B4 [Brachionus angularis]